MAVKTVTLPEPESGTKRPKPTTPKNDAFAMLLSAKPLKLGLFLSGLWAMDLGYGLEMVLLEVVIRKCESPTTNISHENGRDTLMIKCHFVAYNYI